MSCWAKPYNIGIKVYSSTPPSGFPLLLSEAELAVLVNEKFVTDYWFNRMYCTINEYVLEKGVTEQMIENRIGRGLKYGTQTYLESQDGQ